MSIGAEEAACFYAKKLSIDETIKRNFFYHWRDEMTPVEKEIILELDKCDFQQMHSHLNTVKTKDEKYLSKDKNNELSKKNGIAEIDGKEENLKNYKIREHGLFEGKGFHLYNGMITNRIRPEDVTINCSNDSVFPVAPTGTNWFKIVHQNDKQWLASWRDNVQGKTIYMSFHSTSSIKIKEDEKKYEKAKSLSKEIDNIRKVYHRDMESGDIEIKQIAVALYFIDDFLIRGGNEKGEDADAAYTYGCCSLLIKHIELLGDDFVKLDFFGKHSIHYNKTHKVIPIVYKNLESFINGKSDGDNLFGKLTCKDLNKYLETKMNGLTTKVFRTCNASTRYEKYLEEFMEQMKDKKQAYKMALKKVANDCNHTTGNTTKNNYLDPRITFAWFVYNY